jgi:drug/metabolite transporter (DMT)-like permease
VTGRPAASSALIGAGWMLVAVITMCGISICARALARDMSAAEILFFRSVVGVAVLLPWLARAGWRGLATRKPGQHVLRALVGGAAMLCWFASLATLPIGDAIAIQFTLPLFLVIFAALILRESVDVQRWLAVAVGFLGALVIIRPGFAQVDTAVFLVLASAAFYAGNHTLTKSMSATESGGAVAFYMNLFQLPVAGAIAIFYWRTPEWHHVAWILGLGVCGSFAHVFLTRAFAAADASALAPLDFLRLPVVAALGWWLFGDVSDRWTWSGAVIVFAAGYAITRRENALARQRAAERRSAPA